MSEVTDAVGRDVSLRRALCRLVLQLKEPQQLVARIRIVRLLRYWDRSYDDKQSIGEVFEDQLITALVAEGALPTSALSDPHRAIDWIALLDLLRKILPIILDIIYVLLLVLANPDSVTHGGQRAAQA